MRRIGNDILQSAAADVVREFTFGENDGKLLETGDGETKPAQTVPATRDTLKSNAAMTVNVAHGGRVLDAKLENISLRPEPRDVATSVAGGFD